MNNRKMSELSQSVFRDSGCDNSNSVQWKTSKISKWNELFSILLTFQSSRSWNVLILVTVILNYILVTVSLTHAPENIFIFLPFYAVFDILNLANFIMLLLKRFWRVAKTQLQQTLGTTIFVLVLDFVSILSQAAFFLPIYETRYSVLLYYCRIPTILRLHNLFFMGKKFGIFERNRARWILIKYFLILIVFAHTANFVWFFIECRSANCPAQLYRGEVRRVYYTDWYFRHFYVSAQILLNTGCGNILPKNFYEVYLFIVFIILGHGLAVWLVSNFSWYLISRNYHKVFFTQKISDIKRYVEDIDDETKMKILKYYHTMWKYYERMNHSSALTKLPSSLRTDLIYDMNSGLLYRSMLLNSLPEFVLRKISLNLKRVHLLAGEVIYTQYIVKTCMVCIDIGTLEVLNDEDGESRVIAFSSGTIIGESALFVNVPSKATVRATEYTELRILEKKDFLNVMAHFPDIMRNLKNKIDERMSNAFNNKSATMKFSLPDLKRLKMKLLGNVQNEVGTDRDEYSKLYKIIENNSLEIPPKKFILLKTWRIIYALLQAVFWILYSFEVTFTRKNTHYFVVYGIFMDVLCFIEIILQTITSTVFDKNIITDLMKAINDHLNDWRYNLEIFSLFPMELWSHFFEQPVVRNRLYDLLKLNRLLRLYKITEIIHSFGSKVNGRYIAWILEIFLYGLLFYYFSACIIHLSSCPYEICEDSSWYQEKHPRKNYSTHSTVDAIYSAMILSFCSGLDDFLSNSYSGMSIMISIILLAVFAQNYMLGQLISFLFLENFHERQQKLRYYLKRFFLFYRMSPSSYQSLTKIFRIDPYFYGGTCAKFIEKTAPYYMLNLLQTSKIKNTLAEIPLFLMVDSYFLTFVEKQAKIIKIPKNENLYSYGDLTRQMFAIQKGFCNIYNSEDSLERTMGPGTQLGVLEMLFCLPKKHTIITCTDCIFIRIEYTTIRQILELFPKENTTIEYVCHNESFLATLKEMKMDEEFEDNYDIGSHISDQKCFISLTKNWPNYFEVYRKKLGLFWFGAVILMPVSIHPEGFFLILWCVTRSIFIVILGILEPIMILSPPFADELYWWKVICQSSLYFDIYILMHVAYYDGKGFLKTHPVHTFWYYFCHGFCLDLIAALPWEFLVIHSSPNDNGITNMSPQFHYCSWSLLKLIQFYKVSKCSAFFDENIFETIRIMKISNILLAILLVINISTNLSISYSCDTRSSSAIGRGIYDNENTTHDVDYLQCQNGFWQKNSSFGRLKDPLEKYMVGIYTVINFITQTGIDDVTAATFEPRIGAIIIILIGVILFPIFTAVVSNLILEGFVESSENPKDVFLLMNILKSKCLNNDLKRKCFRHFEFIWRHNGGSSHQFIKKFNPELDVNNILFFFYKNILQDVPLFLKLDNKFLSVIVDHLFVRQFIKGEVIVMYKDIVSDIYIVAKGEVDILNKSKEYINTIGPTGVFGNISENFNIFSGSYIIAKENVEVWILNTEKLLYIINLYSVITGELEQIFKNKPSYILPIISNTADISNELEADFDPVVRKSSILLLKYKPIQFCLPQKWFKFSLVYDHGIFKVIDAMTAIASIMNLLTIPYIFVTQEKGLLGYMYLIFEPIFYLRIFFNLHRSYINIHGNLIQSNRKLCKKYLNSPMQLFWDVVPNFPIGSMCFIFPREEWFFSYSCLRLLHILRFYYISQYFEYNSDLHRKIWLSLAKLILYYFFIIHILACTWFMLACPFDNCNSESWISRGHVLDSSVFYRMTLSFYYVLTVSSNVGIDDIPSGNVMELVFTSITMIMGKIMLSILIGSVLRTLYQSERTLVKYQNDSTHYIQYLKERNVPAYQIERTRTYLKNIWDYDQGRDSIKLLELLPNPLKQDVLSFIYGTQLRGTFLFKDIDEVLLREICTKLKRKVYFQDDYIVKHGDVDSTMYFLHQGNVSVLTKHPCFFEILHVTLHPKDLFGVSQGLNFEQSHTFFYRASSKKVEILTLKFDDWSYLLPLFPKDHRRIFHRVEKEYLQ